MNFDPTPRAREWQERLQLFFDAEILPRNRAWIEHVVRRGEPAPFMPELQAKARAAGLWNLGLPDLAPDEPGTRLSNLEYAPIAEILGRVFWASEAFNCHAPDMPNMITLQHACTPEQKERWLRPLLNGETRSAFAMTEPAVASSDATNIACTLTLDGDAYVINGRKWFSTGGCAPALFDADGDGANRRDCGTRPRGWPGGGCRVRPQPHRPAFDDHGADEHPRRAPGSQHALDGLR